MGNNPDARVAATEARHARNRSLFAIMEVDPLYTRLTRVGRCAFLTSANFSQRELSRLDPSLPAQWSVVATMNTRPQETVLNLKNTHHGVPRSSCSKPQPENPYR